MQYLNWDSRAEYLMLMRVDRPIGTYLVAWPALWALWIAAKGVPDLHLLAVFLLGAFLMRSAGCVINDFADRHVDSEVSRTKDRPLARRAVSPEEALQLFALLGMAAASLLLLTNLNTALLSLVAIVLATLYPFMKRYTQLPQVVLGMAFSWAVPMAFIAQTNNLPGVVWWLYLAVVLWVIAYDTFYAMVDRQDDLRVGVKSTAILFGHSDRLITALLQAAVVAIMILVGRSQNLGTLYYLGLAFATLLFIYQQWLISNRNVDRCFKAFLNNHYVGMAIFVGLFLDYSI